jgi:hypothetical protein
MKLTEEESQERDYLITLKSLRFFTKEEQSRLTFLNNKSVHNCCPNTMCEGYEGTDAEMVCNKCRSVLIKTMPVEKEVWTIGEYPSFITSNLKPKRLSYSDIDFFIEVQEYGGYIMAESVPVEKLELIRSTPELLEIVKDLHERLSCDKKYITEAYIKTELLLQKLNSNEK